MKVKVEREKKVIPTYVPKAAMELPMFFEKKPYQGATGRLYPLPFSDSISDDKTDVEYDIYNIENEYLKVEVMPECGGKILRGYDKAGEYDFIYYNEVVKPALVGLAGPWISGGIEFNYPQHHRPTTFMPLEAAIVEEANGEKTVWTGEVEPFNRLKGMVGVSVAEGRSYIKAKAQIYNRTPQNQVFMWWANLAVPVNDQYQTIFPPDVEWVNDHDRRCTMSWPIAKGVYQTARPFDYGEGTDISMYGNVKVPSSFLVSQGQSDMDFVAGYDGKIGKGIVTVANHHISPGKKMWHWGKGDFGDMWCSNLTDENGPYIELMTGVYTDNQPDFTWIAPYESRTFEQYWYPIHDIGTVINATIDAAMNTEVRNGKLFVGFNVTGSFDAAKVIVRSGNDVIYSEVVDMDPSKAYLNEVDMKGYSYEELTVELKDKNGSLLVGYKPYIPGQKQPIVPRQPVARPEEIATVEELYINGIHLEQYKQHNYDARDYYREGLRRDPGDIRCNTGMARLALRNSEFEACVEYADKALERLLSRNQHPADTEAFYLKGLALNYLGDTEEAYKELYKSAWDYRYASPAYYELALIDCKNGAYADALEKLEVSYSYNNGHMNCKSISAVIYKKLGEDEKAKELLQEVVAYDGLDMFAKVLLADYGMVSKEEIVEMFDRKAENFIDVAADLINAGFYEEALKALGLSNQEYPLYDYYRAYCYEKLGDRESAMKAIAKAEAMDEGYCFPSRLDDVAVLKNAIQLNEKGAKAKYYLGCLYYDKFRYEDAITLWEEAVENDPKYAKAYRNLAQGYFDNRKDFYGAKVCMEKALEYRPNDARLFFEYQQILKNMNYPVEKRLEAYDKYEALSEERDDCFLEKLMLLCVKGEYQKAIDMAAARRFHVYEGGEGKLTKLHAWMHVLRAQQLMDAGKYEEAKVVLENGINMPKSYGEAKTFFNQEAHIYYYLAKLQELQGQSAEESCEKGAEYKAAVSEISLFRALCLRKQGKHAEAKAVLDEMLESAENFIANCDRRTYYGVGSPFPMPFELDIVKYNSAAGYTLKAYALLGLGKFEEAKACIETSKKIDAHKFETCIFERFFDCFE